MTAEVWVFHRGALGDSVLLWPRLRRLVGEGRPVRLVTEREKGRLAARELGVHAENTDAPRFRVLWAQAAHIEPVAGAAWVEDYLGRAGEPFDINLRRMFGTTPIERPPPPRSDRARAEVERSPLAAAALRSNPGGPVVMHVGAGSEVKRWPLPRFAELALLLRSRGREVRVIAGEAERERFNEADRLAFAGLGGEYLDSLEALAAQTRTCGVFVGCDSGPTHLSAQLGVPTLALFGPTDPALWGPVGPRVRILRGRPWASPKAAARALRELERGA